MHLLWEEAPGDWNNLAGEWRDGNSKLLEQTKRNIANWVVITTNTRGNSLCVIFPTFKRWNHFLLRVLVKVKTLSFEGLVMEQYIREPWKAEVMWLMRSGTVGLQYWLVVLQQFHVLFVCMWGTIRMICLLLLILILIQTLILLILLLLWS